MSRDVRQRPRTPDPGRPRRRRAGRGRGRAALAGAWASALLLGALLGSAALHPRAAGAGDPPGPSLLEPTRLRVGVGDRTTHRRGDRWVPLVEDLERLRLSVDFLQVWLPRGWREDWVQRERLQEISARGVVPVVVHYWFGDEISRERVEAQRDAWLESLSRMARLVRGDAPVLVILEPEFNNAPPPGETAITAWPGFADALRAAAELVRGAAPNALVGTCPGDFPGTPTLETVLGPVAGDLDFLAFQEMRADTDERSGEPGYLDVGRAAVDYARYLKRAFGRPLLLGYVAVSSHGGWEERQAGALRTLARRREALLEAGVFGLVYFQLHDDPAHVGYFGAAERHFGLIRADGSAKPALGAFRALAR